MINWLRTHEARGRAVHIGLGFAGLTALVSGFSVFLNASAVRSVGDPVLFTTLKNGVAAVILLALAMAFVPRAGATVRGLDRRSVLGLVALGVIGGSIPFVLFFTGLAQASAPAAAVIHKTLFIWVALLAVVLLRERLGMWQLAALAVLLLSQVLITPPDGITWTSGETMIALATGMWAVEVMIAKRVLAGVPSPIAAASRMGIGLVLLAGYLVATGGLGGIGGLGLEQWGWVLGTGLLLSAYVATWYAALRRAPATAVTAILTVAAPITASLQLIANGQVPATPAVAGYAGTLLAGLVVAWLALRHVSATPTSDRLAQA
ncbi:MAG TPA: DMT family transporter [Candidatus Limnocylindria bacterium]|nr:DMT family transporter [Candidatus Limnocylindria bacterium]